MAGRRSSKRVSPVLFLPMCLFGTRFISGLIFRPREGSEQELEDRVGDEETTQEVEEAVEAVEDTVEEVVAEDEVEVEVEMDAEEEEEDEKVGATVEGLEEEEEEVEYVKEKLFETIPEDVATNGATWESLSLPSADGEDIAAAAALPSSAAMEACSRTVLLNQWLKGLAFCQAPRFADRFPMEAAPPPQGGVATPRKPEDLEHQMQRTNCFTNPVYFNLTPRQATPRSAAPPSMTPRSSTPRAIPPRPMMGMPKKKASPKVVPKVEPFVLKKQQPMGGITSRSDGACNDDRSQLQANKKFNMSSISILATPRQVGTGFMVPPGAHTWMRPGAKTGLGISPYYDGARAGLMAHYLEGPRDSVEDLCIPASRLGLAGHS